METSGHVFAVEEKDVSHGQVVFSPTAESFGVSAQIVVWGDPQLRFHQGSTRVPPGFYRFCKGGVVWGGLR